MGIRDLFRRFSRKKLEPARKSPKERDEEEEEEIEELIALDII
jgi:hypothetical protein